MVHPAAWLAHRHLDRARQVGAHRHWRAGLGPLVGGGDVVELRAARVRAAAEVDLCQSAEVLDFLAQLFESQAPDLFDRSHGWIGPHRVFPEA